MDPITVATEVALNIFAITGLMVSAYFICCMGY